MGRLDARFYMSKHTALQIGGYKGERKKIAPKWNEKTRVAILRGVKNGLNLSTVSKLAGISRSTLERWVKKGEEDLEKEIENEYTLFVRKLREAEAAAIRTLINRIDKASRPQEITETVEYVLVDADGEKLVRKVKKTRKTPGDWRAAAYRLDRLVPPEEREEEMQINIEFTPENINEVNLEEAIEIS